MRKEEPGSTRSAGRLGAARYIAMAFRAGVHEIVGGEKSLLGPATLVSPRCGQPRKSQPTGQEST